jgi:hypothetical protein
MSGRGGGIETAFIDIYGYLAIDISKLQAM